MRGCSRQHRCFADWHDKQQQQQHHPTLPPECMPCHAMRAWKAGVTQAPLLLWVPDQLNDPRRAWHLRRQQQQGGGMWGEAAAGCVWSGRFGRTMQRR